jgi:peptidoglycan hydrolase-like protein with peptidoglycan-binding domain
MTDPQHDPRYKVPTPVDIEAYLASLPQPRGPHVRGDGETDEVRLSSVVFQNQLSRRSLSVWHVQRRLGERGHSSGVEVSGYYSSETERAMRDFQLERGLDPTGRADAPTLTALFEGDPNVTLIND